MRLKNVIVNHVFKRTTKHRILKVVRAFIARDGYPQALPDSEMARFPFNPFAKPYEASYGAGDRTLAGVPRARLVKFDAPRKIEDTLHGGLNHRC